MNDYCVEERGEREDGEKREKTRRNDFGCSKEHGLEKEK